MSGGNVWLVVVAGGPLLLVALIVYVLMTWRRQGPAVRRRSDEKTNHLYGEDSKD